MPCWTLLRRTVPGPYTERAAAPLLRTVKGAMIDDKAADRRQGIKADYRIIRTDSRRACHMLPALAAADAKPFHL